MNEVACPIMTPETGHCSTPACDEETSTRRRRQDPAPDCDCCALGSMKSQNPHFMPFVGHRGTLARTLYQKSMVDQGLRTMDKRLWYEADVDSMSSGVRDAFVEMHCDDATEDFLARAEDKSGSILTQLWHALVKLLFGFFFTQTSLNGFLGRGSMFVFSPTQFERLLGGRPGGSLLDIGAGDGAVTAQMEGFFDDIAVTEVSSPMRKILARRKYRILEVDSWTEDGPWDVIACLNVLDRCARPKDLLQQMHSALAPDGRAVIALVLPYQPFVEVGGLPKNRPEQRMPIQGTSFDEQAESFISHVLNPSGFEVERWTRLPYLCEGDLRQAYYWLSDAVFVLKKNASS